MSEKLRVAGIVNDSITDGPGLRLTIFMQGCRRHCPGCHNPQALGMDGGTIYTVRALMDIIRKNPLLSGVTFSGGEPLLQARAILPLAGMVKGAGLDIVIYTGYTFEELLARADPFVMELLEAADTLIDGPYIAAQRSLALPFRGSGNQRVLDLAQSLRYKKPVIKAGAPWAE
jgi:anaerobic ribonucleoside-triphosphate reductase activating protein